VASATWYLFVAHQTSTTFVPTLSTYLLHTHIVQPLVYQFPNADLSLLNSLKQQILLRVKHQFTSFHPCLVNVHTVKPSLLGPRKDVVEIHTRLRASEVRPRSRPVAHVFERQQAKIGTALESMAEIIETVC
jgi:hypothetical protein